MSPTRGINADTSPSATAQGQGDLLDQQPSSGAATSHVAIGIGIAILILAIAIGITSLVFIFLVKKRRRNQSTQRNQINLATESPPPYSWQNNNERGSREGASSAASSVDELVKEPEQTHSNR